MFAFESECFVEFSLGLYVHRKSRYTVLVKGMFLFASVAALLASGCAVYGPNNFWTGGYEDTQLAPDVFRITFQGSAWSGAQNAQDLAMLRAADLTVKNGFSYFAIMTSSEGAWRGSVTRLDSWWRPDTAQVTCTTLAERTTPVPHLRSNIPEWTAHQVLCVQAGEHSGP